MKEVIDFFRRLHDDNTREWFDAHRAEWIRVKGRFADFTGQLIEGIASFDPEVRGLRPQDCTYRIARDTRFSPDKSPYKTYIGAYIAPKGKKSGFAGYYFHIEPCCDSLVCCNLLSAGAVCIEPTVLRSIREEVLDNGAQIEAAIRKAKGWIWSRSTACRPGSRRVVFRPRPSPAARRISAVRRTCYSDSAKYL